MPQQPATKTGPKQGAAKRAPAKQVSGKTPKARKTVANGTSPGKPTRGRTALDLNGYLYSPADIPMRRVRVDFHHHDRLDTIDEPMRGDISGMAIDDDILWLVSDETCSVERLKRQDDGGYGAHRSFDLTKVFDLPGNTEIDLEGMAVEDDWLWLVGSHALKRKKPRPDQDGARKTIKRLGRIEREANRYFLARVPLETGVDGAPELVATARDGREAGLVRMRKGRNDLARHLAKDPHIGPFLDIPAKENGIDIEGIAVSGTRVFLGLRGPVLRGMSLMIELDIKDKGDGRLKLRKTFNDGGRYRLHFLELGGMGIRDMVMDGTRLLLLVGPTMDLDGPVAVVSLKEPFGDFHDVTFAKEIGHVLRIPHGAGTDHAEGFALTPDHEVLVAHDSPDPSRLHDDSRAKDLDLFALETA
ncbi:DUF3616 domain-containing protein [Marivibrio halodurans]|uniref:DUF3616 domain-containing protein n=1 Tax=Marivibrio halodurans TaxID=2039722 RepID=A0A8J7SL61_9PROT|nr:DUF3616 domain-containing protein [Marivibrio halodurans]MBP5855996.1 DUF3616 domain-containing protein [Marivibrio halodurans]